MNYITLIILFTDAVGLGFLIGILFCRRENSRFLKTHEDNLNQITEKAAKRLDEIHKEEEEYMQNIREEVTELVNLSLLAETPIPLREDYN